MRATKNGPAWQQSDARSNRTYFVVLVSTFISVIVCLFASLFSAFLIGEHSH